MIKYWRNLIWRIDPDPPNRQIKFPAKFSGHTVVHNQLLQDAKEMYGFAGNVIVDEEFAAYAEEVVNTNQIVYPPSNYYEALTLYFTLIQDAQEIDV